jgi:hypothetical protein
MSEAVARAARYRPKPNTVCVTRLFTVLKRGVAVLEDAIPAPIAGCKISNGAKTVTIPIKSAGSKDGDRAHFKPNVESKSAAKVIPIE